MSDFVFVVEAETLKEATDKIKELVDEYPEEAVSLHDPFELPDGPCESEQAARCAAKIKKEQIRTLEAARLRREELEKRLEQRLDRRLQCSKVG